MIRISTGNGLTEDYKLGIEKIKPGEELHFRNLDVQVNADYLVSLTERCTCQLTVGIYSGESLLVSESTNLTALAFDQWPGLQYTPELLAAFAMPNHPVVTSMGSSWRPGIWKNGREIRLWQDTSLMTRIG